MSKAASTPASPKPFLKWAGGKGQLVAQLEPFFPKEFTQYHEPFIGGGAIFFHLAALHPGLKACLSDGNPELINCYEVVRDRVVELMAALDEHAARFECEGATYYYAVRAQHDLQAAVARAARMIFLNKTCFNGLWRVNARGRFNVPIGSQLPDVFYDAENLRAASAALRGARLQVADFTVAMAAAQAGDFVYLDPPYVPVSRTADFTSYTVGGFGKAEQQQLAALLTDAAARGVTVVLSNSDTAETRRLYAAFEQHCISARRSINSVSTGRGRVVELVVIARGKAGALPRSVQAGLLRPQTSMQMNLAADYLARCRTLLDVVEQQTPAIQQAADWFAQTILAGRMVHLFGSGHSRILVEEMWPRYGSFPGFNPIVELSLSFHNLVVGANGQRQAMFLENVSGLAERILRNFDLSDRDCALVASSSGCNVVPIEMAEQFKKRGVRVVAIISRAHSEASTSRHASGKKLQDFADLVLDTGAPVGDAMVKVPGLDTAVAPGSTIGGCALVNALKAEVAARLTQAGQPPKVLTAGAVVGAAEATELFEAAYDEHARRMAKLYENLGAK